MKTSWQLTVLVTRDPISPFSGQLLKEIRKKHLLEVKMFGKMPPWNVLS
jgi:hypothetical protein